MDVTSSSKDYTPDIERVSKDIKDYIKMSVNESHYDIVLIKQDIATVKEYVNSLSNGLIQFSEMIEKKDFGSHDVVVDDSKYKSDISNIYTSLDILLAEIFKLKLSLIEHKDTPTYDSVLFAIQEGIKANAEQLSRIESLVIPAVVAIEEEVVVSEPVVEMVTEQIVEPTIETIEEVKEEVKQDESMKMVMVDFYKQLKNIKRSEGCKAVVLKKTFLHKAGNYRYSNNKWVKVFDEKLKSDSNCI